ncbi:MAG: sugar transferase, partial [Verrucomicrobia bacterium]|nr:sugar transferase [Verrucomicrobiota bacterium]
MVSISIPPPRGRFSRTFRRRTPQTASARSWRVQAPANAAPAWDTCPTRTDPAGVPLPFPGWKRGCDLLWVLLLLPLALVLAPVLFCWIKLASPGPCIFRQTRIGRHGKPFTMYKFRTMHPEAETAVHEAHVTRLITTNLPMIKLDDEDGRLIKGACFVRMSGLDELPQLLNILRGEMSAVGPRPCVPSEFQFYDAHHFRRVAVPPGLTGIWQIERTRSTTFREMMAMDIAYVDHLSPWLDSTLSLTHSDDSLPSGPPGPPTGITDAPILPPGPLSASFPLEGLLMAQ